jgi:hypothetical protein
MRTSAEQPGVGRPHGAVSGGGLGSDLARAGLVLILSFVGFVLVPNRLVAYLSLHVVPRTRDALVLLWVIAFFIFMSWLFVRLQGGEGR